MNLICVCEHCAHHEKNNPSIEIDFMDKKISYYCKECKKISYINLEKKIQPFPKTKRL